MGDCLAPNTNHNRSGSAEVEGALASRPLRRLVRDEDSGGDDDEGNNADGSCGCDGSQAAASAAAAANSPPSAPPTKRLRAESSEPLPPAAAGGVSVGAAGAVDNMDDAAGPADNGTGGRSYVEQWLVVAEGVLSDEAHLFDDDGIATIHAFLGLEGG
ncbi:hypothetical protein HK405_005579, partial [Cladochytrium tenue]